MIIAFAAFIALIFYKSRIVLPKFNEAFLNKDMTSCINGIFILLVFFSHFNPYVRYNTASDILYLRMIRQVGQLMVTTFLFYSGYGVMESIKRKGIDYVKAIPKTRILGTYYKFFVAVSLYLILAEFNFPIKRILLSLVSWQSVGNSNWYIFVILLLYFFVYIGFTFCKNNYKKANMIVWGLACVALIVLYKCWGKQHWWYDTILCFPMGMTVSLYREKVIKLFKDRIKTACLLGGAFVLFT